MHFFFFFWWFLFRTFKYHYLRIWYVEDIVLGTTDRSLNKIRSLLSRSSFQYFMKVNLYIIQVKTKISSLLREVKISEATKGVLLELRTFLFEQPGIKARWTSPPYFEKNFFVGSFSFAQLLFVLQSVWLWPGFGYTFSQLHMMWATLLSVLKISLVS